MLTPTLNTPIDLLHKLEREGHRAFHHRHLAHKADHFYNFCITAQALKECIFKKLGILEKADKQPYHDEWSNISTLRAAAEIANEVKHWSLSKPPRTQSVKEEKANIVEVFIDETGGLINKESVVDTYLIYFSDEEKIELYEFTQTVIEYWKVYLDSKLQVHYEYQLESVYFGIDDSEPSIFPEIEAE